MKLENDFQFAQLLCSRLCHDLISPVSAINSGLELLEESGTSFLDDALPLVGKSAAQSNHLLAFFRAAFGSGGPPADWKEQKKLCSSYLQYKKVTLVWEGCGKYESEPMDKEVGRLIINLILLGAECLPGGGHVQVHFAELAEGLGLGVAAKGNRAQFTEQIRAAMSLSCDISSLTARTVQAHYVAKISQQLNSTIEIAVTEGDTVELAALIP